MTFPDPGQADETLRRGMAISHPHQGQFVSALVAFGCLLGAAPIARAQIVDLATIRPLLLNHFESRRLTTEPYGQYKMQSTSTGLSYYASLDVALSRVIMGEDYQTSLSQQQRTEWIDYLHTYARPDGTYSDTSGHAQLHANGMTIGALGPLGGKQLYPATPLYAPFNQPSEVPTYLANNINWTSQWGASHLFWGGLHMYSQSSAATPQWTNEVFSWLDSHVDTNTGWWITGEQPSSNIQGLGGGAHIWPIYEHLGHAFPAPEKVIDRILSMQVSSGRFGGNNSGYMDLDALYGLKYMRSLSPTYRTAEINNAVTTFGQWLNGNFNSFLAGNPTMHETLAKVGAFGLLNQLSPTQFPDSTGVHWTDIFTDQKLYQTAAVETFAEFPEPVGGDQPSIYSNVVLGDGPVGYWRLGQTGGVTATEETGKSALRGTYVGLGNGSGPGNLAQSSLRPSVGYEGLAVDNRAAHLNGSNSYVTVPDSAELDLTGAMTMEAWIKLDALPTGNGGIVGKYIGAGDQRSFLLYVNAQGSANGGLAMVVSPDGAFANSAGVADPTPLPLNQWLHVAGTFQPGVAMKLYLNGVLLQQLTSGVPNQIFSSTADLWMGLQYDSSAANHLGGLIDEVALYNRVLSASEIREHYLAASLLAGDYNADGVVDATDYVVWRKASPDTTLPNDTTPGSVTAADFDVWRSNFGNAWSLGQASAAAAVPEQSSLLLATIGYVLCTGRLLLGRSRRSGQHCRCAVVSS